MPPIVLRFLSDLARLGARVLSRHRGIGAWSTHVAFPAAFLGCALPWSAPGHMGRRSIASSLFPGRATVRPNSSFKPRPLRGPA
jgi:hypothetical protein